MIGSLQVWTVRGLVRIRLWIGDHNLLLYEVSRSFGSWDQRWLYPEEWKER